MSESLDDVLDVFQCCSTRFLYNMPEGKAQYMQNFLSVSLIAGDVSLQMNITSGMGVS